MQWKPLLKVALLSFTLFNAYKQTSFAVAPIFLLVAQ